MIVITRTKTEAEGSVKYECPERNDSLGKETKQPNLQKEERSDKSLRVVVVTKKGWVVNQINQTYFLKGLRMKKSVCLMAVLGTLGATSAFAGDTIAVRFTGTVVDSTCDVVVGSNGNTVHLGTVAPEADKKGALVPVTFSFTNCDDQKKLQSIEYKGGNNGGLDDAATGKIGTSLKNVEIKLYEDETAKNFNAKKTIDHTFTTAENSKVFTPFFARLETGSTGPVEAGTVNSSALFEITYQ